MAVGFGLVTASIIAIASVGLTLQFGVTNYVNFAYGDFMALGAYFAWQVNTAFHWSIWVAMVVGGLGMGVVAVALNRFVLGPFARKFSGSLIYVLIVTFGLSLIIVNLVEAVWGPTYKLYSVPLENPYHLGPLLLTKDEIIIFFLGVVLMAAVHLLLTRTKLGKAMRAMSDDASLAAVTGIDTRRVTAITWFLSGLLAGVAGTVLGVNITSITPSSGETYLFVIFAAVILGGIGRPYGAMIGALVIGLATELSAVAIPAYKLDVAFGILVVVLLVRPQGIFATAGKA